MDGMPLNVMCAGGCTALCIHCAHELTQETPSNDGFGWCTLHNRFVDHQDACAQFRCFMSYGAAEIIAQHPPRDSINWDDYYNDEKETPPLCQDPQPDHSTPTRPALKFPSLTTCKTWCAALLSLAQKCYRDGA